MDKQWADMTADEKADWPKNKIEDFVKVVERLNDAVDETGMDALAITRKIPHSAAVLLP